ncbi:MAG: DUF4349 domain-containing protein [Phycisphaeraceae bacterium]|nr:DUF4349 domain-containing protein [Phycisphaeraceae bacterium]
MLKRINQLSFALIVVFVFTGCSANPAARYESDTAVSAPARSAPTISANATPRQPILESEAPDITGDAASSFKPQIIYKAMLGLRADRVSVVQQKAKAVVESFGGYIGDSSPGRMQVRIPADRFEEALDGLSALGSVKQRVVQAEEASERVVDLESRLRSLHALRDRLIEMVDRAENIKHALEVQKELANVIDQIELINGRLRLTKQQIAYATIDLAISPTPAEHRLTPGIPVAWVRDLGSVFRQRSVIDVTAPRRLRDGVSIDLPDGFIKTSQDNYITQAIDANGVRVRVRRHKNFDGGSTKFWQQLITRSLDDNAGLNVEKPMPVRFERGKPGQLILGSKTMAGETVRYMVAVGVASDEDYVYTFEAWGIAEHVDAAENELNKAIASMRCY